MKFVASSASHFILVCEGKYFTPRRQTGQDVTHTRKSTYILQNSWQDDPTRCGG